MCEHCPSSGTGRKRSSGAGSRSLLMVCPQCPGLRLRAAFGPVVAVGYPSCSCGARYVFDCPSEHVAYCELREDDEPVRHPIIAAAESRSLRVTVASLLPRTGNVAARWRCHCCAGFVTGPEATCKSCRSAGPHHYGEDGGKLGNAHRKRSRRSQPHTAPSPTSGPDLPF